ncbi:biotin carboxylase N-terminal domain-containing protein [Nocardioides sp. R-C-SC26]|uniref:ATP-binding protein n=1 Tax=Nocardioides sp. R-C-SC26 TaxID=2870414 RepID=UPI001E33A75D|nr:biotin carboxylase N-terminal domain-containing protein [Nocardioides sp. R-C-SC26]
MIRRLMVANRAEIASRVFRTCRELGIETVALHSDADAALPYVREADYAVRLPGNTPGETYLDADAVIAAAQRAGADAIHPGYGFLSENAAFARAVEAAGITWVGPTPTSIEQMGSKIGSKELMRAAGVPVLEAPESPTDADLPLLVKASAGGGGRGMRVVRTLADLDSEVERASAEAASAFGDGTVFVEPYVERGRHVEVQVVGDGRGGVAVFGERDCSVQRRHQKVVEEAPAPNLPDDVRAALHEAARAAAAAVDYRGAGTVEFLYDPDTERFYFLEMNTRLQVEHPVTELVHDVDLVAAQLAVAERGELPAPVVAERGTSGLPVVEERGTSVLPVVEERGTSVSKPTGHAIEVRLYAEDPDADYQPQSGRLTTFEFPVEDGVRIDAGFESGSEVSTYYDAMLAKVIVWSPTREQAIRKLAGVLRRARIHGLATNRQQLSAILAAPAFVDGTMTTALLSAPLAPGDATPPPEVADLVAAVALAEWRRERRTTQAGIPVAWRNVASQPQRTTFDLGGEERTVEWFGGRDGYRAADERVAVVTASSSAVTVEVDGVRTSAPELVDDGGIGIPQVVHVDLPGGSVSARVVPRFVDPADAVASGSLLAPMPGTVVRVAVEQGQQVAAGEVVLVLEAMKMQHSVTAPTDGVVTQISVQTGAQVAAGEVMAVVEETE